MGQHRTFQCGGTSQVAPCCPRETRISGAQGFECVAGAERHGVKSHLGNARNPLETV